MLAKDEHWTQSHETTTRDLEGQWTNAHLYGLFRQTKEVLETQSHDRGSPQSNVKCPRIDE
jgi:hypothetical protein